MSRNWKNILVPPSLTIQETLKVIDSEALKLALVVSDTRELLGTVTDGDIRRGLINDLPLSTPVSKIMRSHPTVAEAGTDRETLLALMEKKELDAIPLVEKGAVVGLETLHHAIQKLEYDNAVFLMAGGFGTRLRPLTDNCPKPMLKVGSKPILEIVLLSFINRGFKNFYISTHYLPEMIRDYFGNGERWGVNITYVHEDKPLGTGGALGLLPASVPDLPLIVMNGDVLTNINFEKVLRFHNENNANATICVREYEYQVPFGVIENDGFHIKGMVEKPTHRFHVNAGIYVIGHQLLRSIRSTDKIDMPTLLEQEVTENLLMYPFHEYWLDIGRVDDFNRAQSDVKLLGF